MMSMKWNVTAEASDWLQRSRAVLNAGGAWRDRGGGETTTGSCCAETGVGKKGEDGLFYWVWLSRTALGPCSRQT